MKKIATGAVACLLALNGMNAAMGAESREAVFTVTMTVLPDCSIEAGDVLFTAVGTSQSMVEREFNSRIRVNCPVNMPYSIGLAAMDGSPDDELKMKNSNGDELPFHLFKNEANNDPWGDADPLKRVTATGTGNPDVHDVYAWIHIHNNPAPGAYSAQVRATVYF